MKLLVIDDSLRAYIAIKSVSAEIIKTNINYCKERLSVSMGVLV